MRSTITSRVVRPSSDASGTSARFCIWPSSNTRVKPRRRNVSSVDSSDSRASFFVVRPLVPPLVIVVARGVLVGAP